jgi:hypothetical protein
MSASTRDLERAAQVQFVRAQKAEQKSEDIQHALNLMLNLGFERFHTALTMDGSVHEFEVGTVRNPPRPVRLIGRSPRREHATDESCSGEPRFPEGTTMHRYSKMPSSDHYRSTSRPGVN